MKAVKTITEQVYQAIYDDIMTGALPQGTRLTLKDLQAKLLVSSSPIREALTRLLSDGLIDYQPNIGMSVRTYTDKEINDIFYLMTAFDLMALELAMSVDCIDTLISELNINIEKSESSIGIVSTTEWNSISDEFHNIIWKYSDNTFLNDAASKARMHITIFTTKHSEKHIYRQEILDDHKAILEAIIDGDKQEALKLMETHIKRQAFKPANV